MNGREEVDLEGRSGGFHLEFASPGLASVLGSDLDVTLHSLTHQLAWLLHCPES
jgi:hypothetical protein